MYKKKNGNDSCDRLIWELTRPMWFLLSLMAVYILYLSVQMTSSSCAVDVNPAMICRMVEHLLAGCVITLSTGAVIEYISSKNGKNNEKK